MSTQTVLATYDYPESNTYTGTAQKGVITFRGVKGLQLAIKWLMESLIVAKCRLSDVTPLSAILKVSKIQESYLDYVTDQYELTLYYHASPAILNTIYSIALAIGAAGFYIIAYNVSDTTWEKGSSIIQQTLSLPTTIASSISTISISVIGLVAAYLLYQYTK